MGYQSFNDHILTQLLQGVSFSSIAITPNEAIKTYRDFIKLNLFPNYDEPVWKLWGDNEPRANIEFFEAAAVLTKASLLSGYDVLDLYGKYFLSIKEAYNLYFDLDNDYTIKDYLAMAYLTEQYVYYSELKDMASKTAGDFITLVDKYNCQFNEELINDDFIHKISCFKSQNYIDSSLDLAVSLHSPDVQKMNSFNTFDLQSNNVNTVLEQLDNIELWKANLTDHSKLKLAGLLVWSNVYNEDNGQTVIESFNDIFTDLMQSNVLEINLRMTLKEPQKNIRFELEYELNKKNYSDIMFELNIQEQVQAIAIELTRNSMGLY